MTWPTNRDDHCIAPYAGLVEADRLHWAAVLLTNDPRVVSHLPIEQATPRPLSSADRAIRLIRRARRRRLMLTMIGLGQPVASAPQATYGRQQLAETLRRLPFKARVAVVMIDACGIPAEDVAFALGASRRGVERSLRRARTQLAAAVSLPASLEPLVGRALCGLNPAMVGAGAVESRPPTTSGALAGLTGYRAAGPRVAGWRAGGAKWNEGTTCVAHEGDDDDHGDRTEPCLDAWRLLYMTLTRARREVTMIFGHDPHALDAPTSVLLRPPGLLVASQQEGRS